MPVEYSGEEQAICAVGLVKPRPDVFVEAVQYLLVLCTTVEVCASCSPSVYWHGSQGCAWLLLRHSLPLSTLVPAFADAL